MTTPQPFMSPKPRPASQPQRRPSIDPIRVVRQHIIGLLAAIIIGAVVGLAAHFAFNYFYPLYTSEVLFEVRPGLTESTEIGTAEALKDDEVERIARTQTNLLMQRDVLTSGVENPQVRDTNWMETWFVDPQTGQPLYAQAVDDLEDYLRTPVLRGTNLFAIRWSWHVASDVPKVLNSIATAYTRKLKSLDDQQFSDNEALFDNQLSHIQMSLQGLGDDIHAFIVAKGITTLDDPRFSQASIEIETLSTSLTELQQQLTSIQTQYQQTALKLEGSIEPSHEDIVRAEEDPTIMQQTNRLEILRSEERAMREQYNEEMPQVRQIERQVRAVTEQLRIKKKEILNRNINAMLKTMTSERDRVKQVMEQIEEELESKDSLLRDLAADTSRYQAMKTQQENLEQQRDDATQLLSAIRLMKLRSDASRVRQVGLAELPREPSFPVIEYMIVAGIFLCFGGFIAWIFLRELMENRVRSLADLAVVPGMTVLGAIADIEDDPMEPEEPEMIFREYPTSVVAESCRRVAANILREMAKQGHTSLMLAGGMPGTGVTTVVGNLACAMQSVGHSMCVIDANFRRPRLAGTFGLDDEQAGLGDVLAGACGIDAAIYETESGVAVMPAGSVSARLVERLSDERFGEVMAALRTKYNYVLVDVAPAVAASDATQVAGRCDASALVVRAEQEQRGLVARISREFTESSADFIGGILNRPRQSIGGYFRRNYELMVTYGHDEDAEDES
ncbi:MAG: cellulose synthase operon protein YhjQ/BcsQ [Phycisphaerales bacterium]|nr:cellulose synthase operon protein YhjQ/BcsQ [Phycisphaerales bacterium]MDP7086728.1 cellulose synthase operon protein YhjQ/BcsQ [Phycisphaerales bacterium]MDP7519263.1 cellulose synthase operon protein YhjQ/BcsQ [Phycisphaerales bacterium]HJN79431.1 cellulose synthase operon protein YhjQ/BcsQ [Phycisphaerales bacterium]